MKKIITILGCLILAGLCTLFNANMRFGGNKEDLGTSDILNISIIRQEMTAVNDVPRQVYKIYDCGELLGIITDIEKINQYLDDVYKEKYEEDFPESNLGIGVDMMIVEETSYNEYEDIDDEICEYLYKNSYFSIEAYRIEFSDSKGVYAVIYVKDIDDFYTARNRYLTNYISQESLDLLTNGKTTSVLSTYGEREVSVNILETITVTKEYAATNEIITSSREILDYLCYGENTEPIYYTVQEGDTIDGIASRQGLSSGQEVVTINSDVLSSRDQVITPGDILNIREFESPITVVVVREEITKEVVYPDLPIYREDPKLPAGVSATEQAPINGSANVSRMVTYTNGDITGYEVTSRVVTNPPQQAIYKTGTKDIPGIGTGTYRWPVENPIISCGWGCYYDHAAIDVQNRLDLYGLIYATDRGTVIAAAYQYINGYYVIIDHGNGIKSYYGHMRTEPYVTEGQIVDQGDVIGQIGMSGRATAPHVHFFFYTGDSYVPHDMHFSPCEMLGC